jgi:hypothetical protein
MLFATDDDALYILGIVVVDTFDSRVDSRVDRRDEQYSLA